MTAPRNAAEMREAAARYAERAGLAVPDGHARGLLAAGIRALPVAEPAPEAPSAEEMADRPSSEDRIRKMVNETLPAIGEGSRLDALAATRLVLLLRDEIPALLAERARAASREAELATDVARLREELRDAERDEDVRSRAADVSLRHAREERDEARAEVDRLRAVGVAFDAYKGKLEGPGAAALLEAARAAGAKT